MLAAQAIHLRREDNSAGALFRLTDRLFRAEALPEVFDAALDAIVELMGCQRASILLFDHAGVMRFEAWRGLSPGYRLAVDGHSPWQPGQRVAEPIFVADIRLTDEPRWLKQIVAEEGIIGLGFVPLFANGQVVGKFMTYFPDAHIFSSLDRECAVSIARQVGFTLERYGAAEAKRTAETRLRESEERFRRMAEDAPIMIWISDSEGHCRQLNEMLRSFWGVQELAGFDWTTTLHEDDRTGVEAAMREAIRTHESARVKGRYLRHDGVYRVLETVARPNFRSDGEFDGMIGVNVDITAREEADDHKRLLINELNHRVKNTLAVVQAVARQTFRSDAPRAAQVSAFEGRLSALAQAHNLLAAESWQRASLGEVARGSVNGDADTRVRLVGPRVNLEPKQAVTTAMALHELYTNAVKHGALRTPDGMVNLSWQLLGEPAVSLVVRWEERGSIPIEPPVHRGFGSTMIEQALSAEFDADVDLDYRPAGLVCTVTAKLPLSAGAA